MRLPESSCRGSLRERGPPQPRGLGPWTSDGERVWAAWVWEGVEVLVGARRQGLPVSLCRPGRFHPALARFSPPCAWDSCLLPATPPTSACGKLLQMEFTRGLASRSLQTAAALPPPTLSVNPQRADALPVRHIPPPVGLARRWLGVLNHVRGGQGSAHVRPFS